MWTGTQPLSIGVMVEVMKQNTKPSIMFHRGSVVHVAIWDAATQLI